MTTGAYESCETILAALRGLLGDRVTTSADERRHHGTD